MSDTPRTDAESWVVGPLAGSGIELVTAAFARTLERENARLKEVNNDLADKLLDIADTLDSLNFYYSSAVVREAANLITDKAEKVTP